MTFILRILALGGFCVLVAGGPLIALAQANGQEDSATDKRQALTEGLLDLLPKAPTNSSGTASNPEPQPPATSQQSLLAEVQLGMATAAEWLRGPTEIEQTQGLQNDIVARLDRLIAELEQQSGSSSSATAQKQSPSTSAQHSETPREGRTAASQRSSAPASPTKEASGQGKPAGPTEGQQPSTATASNPSPTADGQPSPGPNSKRGNAVVDMRDPEVLQRSVWGNLPDRVREQMQSRMVERFLPAYREEIEAYYRALSK